MPPTFPEKAAVTTAPCSWTISMIHFNGNDTLNYSGSWPEMFKWHNLVTEFQ